MLPGTVATSGDRIFVVLAVEGCKFAVAPLAWGKRTQRYAGDVPVDLGASFGRAIARAAAAEIVTGGLQFPGLHVTQIELAACIRAAKAAQAEKTLDRFRPLASFAAAQPTHRSGGRRIGAKGVQ